MCLGVPGKVVSIDQEPNEIGLGGMASVDIGGTSRQVSLQFVPEVKVGEYVMIHTGFAMQIIDEKEADEMMEMLKEIADGEVS